MPKTPPRPASFVEIIDLWKFTIDLARVLFPATGAISVHSRPAKRVYRWRARGFIPFPYWDAVIAAVREHHGIELSRDDLYRMAMAARGPRAEAA